MDVFEQRLTQEFHMDTIVTAPNVPYKGEQMVYHLPSIYPLAIPTHHLYLPAYPIHPPPLSTHCSYLHDSVPARHPDLLTTPN